ncbi:MAG: phytoene desaturase family protein [Planctomycetota bacterium]|jgi:phytoene dehydrogenase-like protein
MKRKKIIIIGAGISGLCAGSYLQMNGYDTEIFELHNVPGGLCTGWKRKEYTFDGCIHWLAGSSPADPFYALWSELVDMKSMDFVDHDRQFRFVSRTGETLDVYGDPDRLEKELLEKAPEDARFIRTFTKTIRKFMHFKMPVEKPPELTGLWDKIKMIFGMLPYLRPLFKYAKISVAEIGNACKNPLLREVFTHNPLFNQFAFFGLIMSIAWYGKKVAGYPIGGSMPLARRFEKGYTDRGGKIHYESRVVRIVVEDDVAKGIELENGETFDADLVISAADGHTTIFKMLGGKYRDKKIDDLYAGKDKLLTPFPSLVYVSLGLSREFTDLPHQLIYQIDEPFDVDPSIKHSALLTTLYHFDPTLAPKGKTCVNVMFESFGHDYWTDLRENDRERYKAEKKRIADRVIEILHEKIGDIKDHVEVVDVATPATFIRYTNNWRGSYEGWLPGPGALMVSMSKELPGLRNFYQIGQWVMPGGGLPSGVMSGRHVTQIICKRDGKTFTTK